jgi:hypothetical protein
LVYPPSRIVSHSKDKKFPWPLPAHSPSEKAVGTWERENPSSGIKVAHYLPLGGVNRDFHFTEMRPEGTSHILWYF